MDPLEKLYKAEEDCLQTLSNQTITLDGPGTILRDFHTMLDLFESGFIQKTTKGDSIDSRRLAESISISATIGNSQSN